MKIAIDFDDVIFDLAGELLNLINKDLKTDFEKRQLLQYDWWEYLNMSQKRMFLYYEKMNSKRNFINLREIEGSISAIKKIGKKHELNILTSRSNEATKKAVAWLDHNLPGEFAKVLSTNMHHLNIGQFSKGDLCKVNKIDLIIDDHIGFAEECVEKGIEVFLFDQPWNKNYKHEKMHRCLSWQDVIAKI